jgi:hypothetical protein
MTLTYALLRPLTPYREVRYTLSCQGTDPKGDRKMNLQEYINRNQDVLVEWIISAFGYVPTQETLSSISFENWISTFPALRKEAMEHGVQEVEFNEPDSNLYRYILSLQ